jgi:hypothetical protein
MHRPEFTFWTKRGRVTISCELDFARWLVNTDRVHMGVWRDYCCNIIYL